MARVARVAIADVAHHVTQRGNARQFVLATDSERMVYLDLLRHAERVEGVSPVAPKSEETSITSRLSLVFRQ